MILPITAYHNCDHYRVHIDYVISRYQLWNRRPCDYRGAQQSDDIAHESKYHVCPAQQHTQNSQYDKYCKDSHWTPPERP